MERLQECAVSIASDLLLPHVKKVATNSFNAIKDVPKDVAAMKIKLDVIQANIHDADKMAAAEEDKTALDEIKTKMKQMIETSFRMEDIMDEYTIREEQLHGDDPGCAAIPSKTVEFAKAMTSRLQFAYMNEDVKSEFQAVQERNKSKGGSQNESSSELRPSSSGGNPNDTLVNLREAPLYIKEADVVGFDEPRKKLIDWLVDERKKLTVICVVGMGGQGKTTLAKKVFDNKRVVDYFIYYLWITVSQSYSAEGLLRKMVQKLRKLKRKSPPTNVAAVESLPENVAAMDKSSLIEEVREHLDNKRYVIVFDDIWNTKFWNEMEFAFIDNESGSRIFITTRNIDVATQCKRSVSVQVHELQPLDIDMSLALFNKKAFGSDLDGRCPNNLEKISKKIVKKCKGLPLAIVAIGGLLSLKVRDPREWKSFSQNLSLELGKNPKLTVVTKILALSYHDLPYHLKQCFLYFGIFLEDYEVECARLIQLWIAEGLVQYVEKKTLEEVANQYLTELIERNLVQKSSFTSFGKTKSCRVHDLVRDMILEKAVDLSFCHFANEHENQSQNGMTRRLTIASSSNNLSESVASLNIRSLHFFGDELPEYFVRSIPTKYKLLKVLDFEGATLYDCVPQNLEDFFLLRYLSFKGTLVKYLPSSIGMLLNLETLDLRQTQVREIPREINKLKKLRHLLGYDKSKVVGYGIQLKDGIGDLTSLQTLREVEADNGGVDLIKSLEGLTLIRVLGLTNVRQEFKDVLCSSMREMTHLEKLYIAAINEDEVIDLNFDVRAPQLRKLSLVGKLSTFPNWVARLQNLVQLSLSHSKLTHDPLRRLKDLPNLLYLSILYRAYEGESLRFQDGGFRNLKQVVLRRLYNLNSITVDTGALPSLKKFMLVYIPQLMEVPNGIYNLQEIEVFHIVNMPDEFEESIDHSIEKPHWIIEKVPFVNIKDRFWA